MLYNIVFVCPSNTVNDSESQPIGSLNTQCITVTKLQLSSSSNERLEGDFIYLYGIPLLEILKIFDIFGKDGIFLIAHRLNSQGTLLMKLLHVSLMVLQIKIFVSFFFSVEFSGRMMDMLLLSSKNDVMS